MQKTLTTVLALVCGMNPDISQAQTSEEPLEEIVVTGEYAGPGMWQVTHRDHPGHTLWIVGEPPLLPKGMRFRSEQVAHVASQSQEILMQTGSSLKPDKEIGVFRMLTLVPAALKLRKNPDKATLQELIPSRSLRALAGAKEALSRSRLGSGENAALPGGRETA
jgi:hypothetical protein